MLRVAIDGCGRAEQSPSERSLIMNLSDVSPAALVELLVLRGVGVSTADSPEDTPRQAERARETGQEACSPSSAIRLLVPAARRTRAAGVALRRCPPLRRGNRAAEEHCRVPYGGCGEEPPPALSRGAAPSIGQPACSSNMASKGRGWGRRTHANTS